MSRPRKKNTHLPQGVHPKHGAYYLVRNGKWIRLGKDLTTALREYGRIMERPDNELGTYLDRFLEDAEKRCKASTVLSYRYAADTLRKAFADFALADIEPSDVYRLMDHFREHPNLANRIRTVLKQTLDHAVLMGEIPFNPVASIPRLKENARDRYVTDEEYVAIWRTANSAGYQGPHLAAIMDMAYFTAQRINDVLAIRRQDITDEGVYFRTQKGEKRLLVRLGPEGQDAVQRALALHGETPKLYLLALSDGRKRSYTGVANLFRRYANKAEVYNVTLHDFRAKSLTDAKKQGLDSQTLGTHATEQQNNRYIRNKETLVAEGPSFRHKA